MYYNGLESDMILFSKFVFIYETIIRQIKKKEEFIRLSKEANDFFSQRIQGKVKYGARVESVTLNNEKDKTIVFTSSKAIV